MTVKLGESSGEEGVKKLGKRAGGDEESLEEEGAGGGGEAAPGSSSTKKEEKIINSNTTSSSPPNPSLSPAPASLQPSQSQDQHHFLRSSVRPQSKRLKKDSQASSSVGSSTAGKGKVIPEAAASNQRQGCHRSAYFPHGHHFAPLVSSLLSTAQEVPLPAGQ